MFNIDYLVNDPPLAAVNPSQFTVTIDSNGHKLLSRVFKPSLGSEDEKRPAVIIMHGIPGGEQWRDLAQALRRVGFVAITFTFSGAWGSGGGYHIKTLPEDALNVIDFVKKNSELLSVDPSRIYTIGHSLGGFTTVQMLRRHPAIKASVLLAPCNMSAVYTDDQATFRDLMQESDEVLRFDPGEDSSVLVAECEKYHEDWSFTNAAKDLDPALPKLIIGAENDTICPPKAHIEPLLSELKKNGHEVEYLTYPSDHSFQTVRIALLHTVASWLIDQEKNN